MESVMVNSIVNNVGYSRSPEKEEGQPLCMRGSLNSQDTDCNQGKGTTHRAGTSASFAPHNN
jgi:hypothetical protein